MLEIKNVKRVGSEVVESIFIEGNTIAGWNLSVSAEECIDGKNATIAPALIELHAHLREPGQEEKEDLASGLAAAAAGGYGTVVCMPNTSPVIDDPSIVRSLIAKAESLGFARLKPSAALTVGQKGEQLADLAALKQAGAVMFTDDGRTNENANILRRGLEYAHSLGIMISVHAEDASLRQDGVMNEGKVSEELGLPGNSRAAEAARIARDVEIVAITGAKLHVQHLSTAEGLNVVRHAKARGLPITCEVCPHHLLLNDEHLRTFNPIYKVAPPLRTPADSEALLQGILDGTVDCLATDHAPHTQSEKEKDMLEAPFGIPSIEVAFPLMYTHFVKTGKISLEKLIALFTTDPAKVMDWQAPSLEVGSIADIVLLDLDTARTVDPKQFKSKAKFSPWTGESLYGFAALTLVNGQIAYQRAP